MLFLCSSRIKFTKTLITELLKKNKGIKTYSTMGIQQLKRKKIQIVKIFISSKSPLVWYKEGITAVFWVIGWGQNSNPGIKLILCLWRWSEIEKPRPILSKVIVLIVTQYSINGGNLSIIVMLNILNFRLSVCRQYRQDQSISVLEKPLFPHPNRFIFGLFKKSISCFVLKSKTIFSINIFFSFYLNKEFIYFSFTYFISVYFKQNMFIVRFILNKKYNPFRSSTSDCVFLYPIDYCLQKFVHSY